MFKITNRLDQPLVINIGSSRVLHLLAGGTAILSDEDYNTPEVQSLQQQGAIETVSMVPQERRSAAREGTARRKEG